MSMVGLFLVLAAYVGVEAGGASPRPSVDELLVFGLGSSDQMVMIMARVSEGKRAEGCVRRTVAAGPMKERVRGVGTAGESLLLLQERERERNVPPGLRAVRTRAGTDACAPRVLMAHADGAGRSRQACRDGGWGVGRARPRSARTAGINHAVVPRRPNVYPRVESRRPCGPRLA